MKDINRVLIKNSDGLRIAFWICILIAVGVVVRRLIALALPSQLSGPPEMTTLDQVFASHAALTLAHLLPSLVLVILIPFALMSRYSHLVWPERVLFPLGTYVALTAYAMSRYSVGGWTERSAVLFYNSLYLYSLGRAWLFKNRAMTIEKRRWLTRAVGVLLGIATTRPVMALFFATSKATHLAPKQFFGIAFWIGFTINWVVVEIYLSAKQQSI